MQVFGMKVIIFLLTYTVELVCVMLPRFAKNIPADRRDQVLSLAQACSGGIFVGVIAHDMVPSAITDWSAVISNDHLTMQLTMTCIVVGFLFILFIEKVALVDRLHPKDDACETEVLLPNDTAGYCTDQDSWAVIPSVPMLFSGDETDNDCMMLSSCAQAGQVNSEEAEFDLLLAKPKEKPHPTGYSHAHGHSHIQSHSHGHSHGHGHGHGHSHGHAHGAKEGDPTTSSFSAREVVEKTINAGFALVDKHRPEALEKKEKLQLAMHAVEETFSIKFAKMAEDNPLMYISLTLVLSVHTLIAGVAMGVTTDMASLISLYIGVMSHIWAVAMALGVSVERAGVPLAIHISVACVWSSALPAGLVIGTFLLTFLSQEATLIIQGFFTSLASGTFIYVAIVDILLAEFTKTKDKYLKFILCLFGYISITTLLYIFT